MPDLSISRLIRTNVSLTQQPAEAQSLSTLLCLTSSTVIDVTERIRSYNTIDEVASDFGVLGIEYAVASLYFNQDPKPKEIMFGRWAKDDSSGQLFGGAMSAAQKVIGNFTAITSPSFYIELDGMPYSIAPSSFASVTNLNGVASLIQTALAAKVAGTTCVYNAAYSRMEITSGSSGVDSVVSYAKAPTATGSITFSVNPSNNDTITLNGTAVTFKTSPSLATHVQIAGTLAGTLDNLLTMLSASTDVQLVKFRYFVNATKLGLAAATAGTGGNSLTLAASAATVSAGTLAGGGGTDISGLLNLITSLTSGVYVANGMAAETALESVVLFDSNFGQRWYGLDIPEATDDDVVDVSGYIEGSSNAHIHFVSTISGGSISSVVTTDIGYVLSALNYKRSCVQYSSTNAYAVSALAGRSIVVDYTGNNTVITLMHNQAAGVIAESLTPSQADVLESKHINVFVKYNNNTSIIQHGVMSNGDFIDQRTIADAFQITLQTALYNLLYTSKTRIPQDDSGTMTIINTIEAVCAQFVANGAISPRVWDNDGFGTLKRGDYLPKGYYVYAPSVNVQNTSDRAARKSVPIRVAATLAGAVHTIDVDVTLSR